MSKLIEYKNYNIHTSDDGRVLICQLKNWLEGCWEGEFDSIEAAKLYIDLPINVQDSIYKSKIDSKIKTFLSCKDIINFCKTSY